MKHAVFLMILALPAGIDWAQPPQMPAPEAWDMLRQGITDSDAQHRKTAIAAAGTIGSNEEAVKLVAGALQDRDVSVRQTAAATLGEMAAPGAIPALKNALEDSPEVSFTAAKALWNLGDTTGRAIFQEVIEGERTDTPGRMHSSLQNAKKKLSPKQLALMGVEETSGTFLGPAGIAVMAAQEAMKETKKEPSAPGRVVAAGVLAKDQDAYALTLLEWALSDKNWAVRVAVAKALGERGNADSIAKLAPLLHDDRHAVRYMAAASIVKLSGRMATASSR